MNQQQSLIIPRLVFLKTVSNVIQSTLFNGEEPDSTTVSFLSQKGMPSLPVLTVIKMVTILHFQRSVIHAIRLIIIILQIQSIQPLVFPRLANYAIPWLRDGNRLHIRNMTVNLFRFIRGRITENGMHAQIATLILQIIQFLVVLHVMNITKPQWIMNIQGKEDIHTTVQPVTDVIPEAWQMINIL